MVEAIDHTGERGRFTCACRTGDQNEPLFELGARHDLNRDVILLRSRKRERNDADDRRERTALTENVHAETPEARYRERIVVIVIERVEERIDIAPRKTVDSMYDLARVGWHERRIPAHLPAFNLICERQARPR